MPDNRMRRSFEFTMSYEEVRIPPGISPGLLIGKAGCNVKV